MSVDVKNIIRLDIEDILKDCIAQSFYAIRPYTQQNPDLYHPDVYAISENEKEQVFKFAMEGASKIADSADMVKHHTQTGIDALTYYSVYEDPTNDASYDEDAETIETPEGDTELVSNISGMNHVSGQKLTKDIQDTVVFEITDLEDDQYRYTVVQQHIKTALVKYALYEWWKMNSMGDLAKQYY